MQQHGHDGVVWVAGTKTTKTQLLRSKDKTGAILKDDHGDRELLVGDGEVQPVVRKTVPGG